MLEEGEGLLRQVRERLFLMSMFALNFCSPPRSLSTKERSSYWWDHNIIVNSTFSTHDWLDSFRMSQVTFVYVCDEVRSAIEKADTETRRKAIPVEQRVALTLWYLATNTTIGHLFGVSKAMVCMVTKEVCAAIVKVLLPRYIRVPAGDKLKKVVDGFKDGLGFPQCAGVVDGTHIFPEECPAKHKGFHSIIMQGMVDNLGRFMEVYTGWPGRVHDAGVFVNSSQYKERAGWNTFP